MNSAMIDIYKGWTVSVTEEKNKCANYSFDITAPSGYTQHVSMGGENEQRAIERAREMIDMEIAMTEEE